MLLQRGKQMSLIKYVDRKSIRSYGCVASNPTLCDSLNVQTPELEADTTIKAYRTWPIVVGIVAIKAFEWAAEVGGVTLLK